MSTDPNKPYESFIIKGILSFPQFEKKVTFKDSKPYVKFSVSICFEEAAFHLVKAKVDKIKTLYSKYQSPVHNFRSKKYDKKTDDEGNEKKEQYLGLKKGLPVKYSWRMTIKGDVEKIKKVQIHMQPAELSQLKSGDYVVFSGMLTTEMAKNNPHVVCYIRNIGVLKQKQYKLQDGSKKDAEFDKLSQEGLEEGSVDEFEKELSDAPVESKPDSSFEEQLKEADVPQ